MSDDEAADRESIGSEPDYYEDGDGPRCHLRVQNKREGWREFVCKIVDLVRHAQLVLKSKTSFDDRERISAFLLVNSATIVALGERGLWLLRMHAVDEEFEAIRLAEHVDSKPSYVLKEITGKDVDVKHAVIQRQHVSTTLRFARLNVDDARLDVDRVKPFHEGRHTFQLSKDGRYLFGICGTEYEELSVYDIEQNTGTLQEVPDHFGHSCESVEAFLSTEHVYFVMEESWYQPWNEDSPRILLAYRWNYNKISWEILSINASDLEHIAPLVNAESGEDEGILFVKSKEFENKRQVNRYLFNTVDSLQLLAMDAFRKHYTNVKGELNFHTFLNETTPGKKILPSMYPNMKPFNVLS